jgi:transposase
MRALDPTVVDAVWAAVAPLLPARRPDSHPLGCHRPRIPDRHCLWAMLVRLVTGCSWETAAQLVGGVSAATLRRRRDEWIAAGVFEQLAQEAICGYDRICGLDLTDVSIDGSLHKAPCGGEGTGKNPTDRGKLGYKWSLLSDKDGIPLGWAVDGANRHDIILLVPTLEAVAERGLLNDVETIHLDRGYDASTVRDALAGHGINDAVIARKRQRGDPKPEPATGPQPLRLGLRWAVERTNSWFSNFGQLRRNTDRRTIHRLAQIALAAALIITVKLIDWARRWSPRPT